MPKKAYYRYVDYDYWYLRNVVLGRFYFVAVFAMEISVKYVLRCKDRILSWIFIFIKYLKKKCIVAKCIKYRYGRSESRTFALGPVTVTMRHASSRSGLCSLLRGDATRDSQTWSTLTMQITTKQCNV